MQDTERTELEALTRERCRQEEAALLESVRRRQEESARLGRRAEEAEQQNRALDELVREQERYLSDVETVVAEMELRRRRWQERYAELTGTSPRDPTVAGDPR